MLDLDVIDQPATAAAMLDPIRASVLAALTEPGSATTVADGIGMSRQKVNYHLRALEDLGLVRFVEERQRRGLAERVFVASAKSYALSPEVLGACAASPSNTDRLSSRYLIAVAARMVSEVADLVTKAEAKNQRLATLSIDTEIRFASAHERAAFTAELAEAVTTLAAKYHDEKAADGRSHRLVVAAHPSPSSKPSSSKPSSPKPASPSAPNKPTNESKESSHD